MRINQLKAGSILSYMQMALRIIVGLVYTPVMIRLLGQSEYGLYNTVSSTISMLSLLSLGFNSGYIRYYAKYKKNNDKESIYKLNGLFLIIFIIIGILCLVCGMFLSYNLDLVFDEGLTQYEYSVAKILMILLTVNMSISFPMSVFANIVSANERYMFLKILSMLNTVVSPLVTLPLLLMGYRSVAMVVVTVLISLVTDVVYMVYVIGVLKNRFIFHDFEKGIFKSLFIYTSFIAMNMVIDQINWNVDKFLLGRFKGTTEVAIYSVGYNLYNYYMMFSTSISGVFTPRIHKIVNASGIDSRMQDEQLTDLFTKIGRIQFIVLALIATGVVFFGKLFIAFWAGEGYERSYYVAVFLIVPATIALIQNLGIEIQRAKNKHQFRSVVYIIMAIVNLILSIQLCQRYGAIGSTIGTAIALIVANGFIMNVYYHKKCGINIIFFWKNIIRLSVGLILPICFGMVIIRCFKFNSLIKLSIGIVMYTLVYFISMWCTGMNQYEKSLVIKPVRRIVKK